MKYLSLLTLTALLGLASCGHFGKHCHKNSCPKKESKCTESCKKEKKKCCKKADKKECKEHCDKKSKKSK